MLNISNFLEKFCNASSNYNGYNQVGRYFSVAIASWTHPDYICNKVLQMLSSSKKIVTIGANVVVVVVVVVVLRSIFAEYPKVYKKNADNYKVSKNIGVRYGRF